MTNFEVTMDALDLWLQSLSFWENVGLYGGITVVSLLIFMWMVHFDMKPDKPKKPLTYKGGKI